MSQWRVRAGTGPVQVAELKYQAQPWGEHCGDEVRLGIASVLKSPRFAGEAVICEYNNYIGRL